ncbi:zf-CGNR multi-domain protein [bacterium]|nr:MAG: zf-CGNR multi-domain protein [bacterium]
MSDFYWIGERLWLDAVNSEFISDGERTDGWCDSVALQGWLHEAATRHQEAESLRDFSLSDNGEALLTAAKQLRAALRLTCESANKGKISNQAIEAINAALKHHGPIIRVENHEDHWHEHEVWNGETEMLLWLLARSAAHSLSRGELGRLKPCASPDCILWFLDTSKNGTRRWCSMDACGNRHKVAAHHKRRKQGQSNES